MPATAMDADVPRDDWTFGLTGNFGCPRRETRVQGPGWSIRHMAFLKGGRERESMMRRFMLPVIGAVASVAAGVAPAAAVVGGQADGNGHPYGALVLMPDEGFCSGTLIDEDVVLTSGHCTNFLSGEVFVTFDPDASVDETTWEITGGTWYTSDSWVTHPQYVEADWPFTYDYGLVFLDQEVQGIEPAQLPEPYLVDALIGTTGQTQTRFNVVGYGVVGVTHTERPYTQDVDFVRKVTTQRFNPSKGVTGTQDPLWLPLGSVPSKNHGAGCPGDSGGGVFVQGTDTIVAVHTGGYSLGFDLRLCGRVSNLEHRIDQPEILNWIESFVD